MKLQITTTTILALMHVLGGLQAHAIETDLPVTPVAHHCAVRLSNQEIERSFSVGQSEKAFCSGTLVAPDLVVTAAHCLNEAISGQVRDLESVGRNVRLNMAVQSAQASESYELASGNSAFYSPGMRTHSDRQSFLQRGQVALVREDLVVLRLQEAVEGFDAAECPALPTVDDCESYNAYTQDASRDMSRLGAHFYRTRHYEQGHGAGRRVYPYPTNYSVALQATALSRNLSLGYLTLSFNTESNRAELAKGDSGTGLLWQSDSGRKVLVGVQSAALRNNRAQGLFADMCAILAASPGIEAINAEQ